MKIIKFNKEESDNILYFFECYLELRTVAFKAMVEQLKAREAEFQLNYHNTWKRFFYDKCMINDCSDFQQLMYNNVRFSDGKFINFGAFFLTDFVYKHITPLSTEEMEIILYFINNNKLKSLKNTHALYKKYAVQPFDLDQDDALKLEKLYEDFVDLKNNLSTISSIEISEPKYSSKTGFLLYER